MRGHFHLFSTPLGTCAIAWTERGISRVLLPPADSAALTRDYAESRPPRAVKGAIEKIVAHLEGRPQDFSTLAVDLEGISPFHQRVYEAALRLGSGEVCSYGELARQLGKPGAARAVGQALGRNPIPVIIPCHRILAAGGKAGGFSAPGGIDTKAALLRLEGYALQQRPRTLWDAGAREEAVAHLRKRDRLMRKVIDAVGPCRLEQQSATVFDALCESIIYQQLAGKAAAAITRRFMTLFDGPPTAAALIVIDEPTLRAAGLSNGKVRALRALATAVVDGTVNLERVLAMSDDEVSRHLTAVKGIGPWTVQMLLIFHLGRPDVFPLGDLGIRKAIQRLAGWDELPDAARMAPLAEKWAPWRSVATWYLWRSLGTQTMGDAPL